MRFDKEPPEAVLSIIGAIRSADMPTLCSRLRRLLKRTAAEPVICDVGRLVDEDALAVDALARLQLTARRSARNIRLRHASGELRDLLGLMGLAAVLPLEAGLAVETRRQAKQREEPGCVEEEGDAADPRT